MIYLDHNATTPVLDEVVDAMLPALREHWGNPSSGHAIGKRAARALDEARGAVAFLLGAKATEIVFTSGGTEANNLAIFGALEASARRHVVTSSIEHPATARPCDRLEQRGVRVTRLPVDREGVVREDDAERAIDDDTALVSVMHANNETGVLQPIAALAARARRAGALMHADAAQSVGKVSVDVDTLGVDLLSIAGHKLYAPKGIGVLYVRRGTPLAPFTLGAAHEAGLRPGTENVAGAVGLAAACIAARRDLDELAVRLVRLREALWARLVAGVPGVALTGPAELRDRRLPNTLHVRFPRVAGSAVLARAPDVAASTGSACHDGHESASAVLLAMGISSDDALGAVRLTLGRGTTADAVDRAATALIAAWGALSGAGT